jgi:hypothetical protein
MIVIDNAVNAENTHKLNFLCDDDNEVANLPTRITDAGLTFGKASMGSTCYVINTKAVYMLNGASVWVKIS